MAPVSSVYDSVIAVVIVNYRTPQLVAAGLQALSSERKQFPQLHVVVVDNDSGDASAQELQELVQSQEWNDWVKIFAAEKNGGYAYGNNRGFDEAKSWLHHIDYYWMLNPDTQVLSGATLALIDFLVENPRTIAGSCLQDRDGTKQVSTFNFPSVISELCSGFGLGVLDKLFAKKIVCRNIPVAQETSDWMAGASLMFSSHVQQELGHIDENYFLYFEEVDYLLQAHRRGIYCWYLPESRVIHEVGASTGISDVRKQQPRRPAYWFESRRRYFLKNYGGLSLLAADFLWLIGHACWVVRKTLSKPEDLKTRPPKFAYDFFLKSDLNPKNWINSLNK